MSEENNNLTLLFSEFLELIQEEIHNTYYNVETHISSNPVRLYVTFKKHREDTRTLKCYFVIDYLVEQFCKAAKCPFEGGYYYANAIIEILDKLTELK